MKFLAFLNSFLQSLNPVLADITLNPDFNANALLKAIVNVFSVACIVAGVLYGLYNIAQSVTEESPSRQKKGIEIIIFSIMIGSALVTFLNMVIL